jgi:DNA-binding transcriptional LysR family regulator
VLNLTDLRAFVRIADLRSISAAARALKAPKSSVSHSLIRLEAAVGAVLVERSTRHMRLTDAGLLFQPHALRILGDVEEAEAALGGLAAAPRGILRINAPYALTHGLLAPMLPTFLARYPEVLVTLDVNDRLIDMLAEEADLVIRIGTPAESGLVARRLATLEIWACASPAYLATRGTPATMKDLHGHDIIGRSGQATGWGLHAGESEPKQAGSRLRAVVPDPAALLVVLLGGAGIGRLPDFMAADAIARGELVRVLADLQPDTVDVHALYPSRRSLSAKVRVFIDSFAVHLASVRSTLPTR